MEKPATQLVYVGTYTEADSQGIEIYALNPKTGRLSYLKTVAGIVNPSYLQISADRRFLFAVNEITGFRGRPTGTLSAFKVDSFSGDLTPINRVSSHGRAPCYLTLSSNGRFVLANNYLDGTAGSFPVLPNGALGDPVSIIHQKGSGPNLKRQEASHIHCIQPDPQNHFVITTNLGTDRLSVYAFDSGSGRLSPLPEKTVHTTPGAGPRHLAFSRDGRNVYVANELNNTVEAFSFDRDSGNLRHFQTLSTVPSDFKGTNYPGDIHLSPDGRFLYVSNRGDESLAIFSVESHSGRLAFLSTEPVRGSWPRNFTLSKDGRLVLVANQKSRTIASFRRDASTGFLHWLASIKTHAAPACVKITPF